MVKLRTFKTTDQLISKTVELLRKILSKPGNLMLSGGSTPYAAYNRIAAAPGPVHPRRRLFLSDERIVPADSPNSNSGNLMPMLRTLGCEDRFIRVDTRLPAAEAASRFARDLEPLENIDLGLLGIGADGHTAGFFTLDQARMKSGTLTLHTDRPDGIQGVSVTPALLNRIGTIILLVAGESKREIINILLNEPGSIPAGVALSDHSDVELWTNLEDL